MAFGIYSNKSKEPLKPLGESPSLAGAKAFIAWFLPKGIYFVQNETTKDELYRVVSKRN